VTIAEAGRGRGEKNDKEYFVDIYLESPDLTPAAHEVEEGLYDINKTTSITLTLGAWLNISPTESFLRYLGVIF
jgi:hypothetical protein